MNPYYPVKEEYPGSSSSDQVFPAESLPSPMEGLNDAGPPPFLTKTFEIVDDQITDNIISWSRGGTSFVVWDLHSFSSTLLPRYFKHGNFSSFVRQLNTYGFRKIDPDKWEFANEGFLRSHKQLLKNIRRRRPTYQSPSSQPIWGSCVEVGQIGANPEGAGLRRDKQALVNELLKLRQEQQKTRAYLQSMEHKLRGTETKQKQMMNFLARAMQNPAFVKQLLQHKEKRNALAEAMGKKRSRSLEQGSHCKGEASGSVKDEPVDFGFQASAMEALASEMEGFGGVERGREDEFLVRDGAAKDQLLDEMFWEELLNARLEEELVMEDGDQDDDEAEEEEEDIWPID